MMTTDEIKKGRVFSQARWRFDQQSFGDGQKGGIMLFTNNPVFTMTIFERTTLCLRTACIAIGNQQPGRNVQQAEPSPSRKDFARVHFAGIIARLCAAIVGRVPVGYEDEAGFHFGTEYASH